MTINQTPPKPSPKPRKSAARRPAKASPAGDQISGSIGNNARGAIIGKNIFQNIITIGTVKIPVIPVLVLIVLVVAAAAFFGLRLLGPDHMTGSFNLAVAEFGQLDANGRVSSSSTGQTISQRLYEGLKIELESLSPADRANFQPQVWQDSLDITQKRVQIGIIPGDTALARWTAACDLAKKINASVMIYGNLPANSSASDFVPEFALCDNAGLRIDVDELVGSHQLIEGLPAQLISQLSSPDAALAINIKMNSWSGALSQFCIGIMYDLQGRPEQALAIFQQARGQLLSGSGTAVEVLHFFIGREELTLAASTTGQDQATHLANAQASFTKALLLNPTYARAHIGLGGVFFTRAQFLTPADRLQSADLASTFKEYTAALANASSSPGALIDVKARLSLASAWLLQGDAQSKLSQVALAAVSFNQAIQAATSALQPLIEAKQYRILAQAYLSLGEAYQQQGHLSLLQDDTPASLTFFEKSSTSYQQCIDQKDAAITDQTLAKMIVEGLCRPYKKDVDASLAELK